MRLLVILSIVGGLFYAYNQQMIPGLNTPVSAYSDSGEAKIILYTSKDCGSACSDIVKELRQRRAKFEEVQLPYYDPEDPLTQQYEAHGGSGRLPYMVSGDNHGVVSMEYEVAAQLALTFGEKYLKSHEKKLYKKHFDASGNPIVVMYGAQWCGYCRKLEKELVADNVEFIEIDLDGHHNKKAIARTMHIGGYPTSWYGFRRVGGRGDYKSVKRTIKMASR